MTIDRRGVDDENVIAIVFGFDVDASVDGGGTAIVVTGDRSMAFSDPPESTAVATIT